MADCVCVLFVGFVRFRRVPDGISLCGRCLGGIYDRKDIHTQKGPRRFLIAIWYKSNWSIECVDKIDGLNV